MSPSVGSVPLPPPPVQVERDPARALRDALRPGAAAPTVRGGVLRGPGFLAPARGGRGPGRARGSGPADRVHVPVPPRSGGGRVALVRACRRASVQPRSVLPVDVSRHHQRAGHHRATDSARRASARRAGLPCRAGQHDPACAVLAPRGSVGRDGAEPSGSSTAAGPQRVDRPRTAARHDRKPDSSPHRREHECTLVEPLGSPDFVAGGLRRSLRNLSTFLGTWVFMCSGIR